jgi:predicted nucleic acid-binding protein
LIAYVDSSVVLRVVLGQEDQLSEWKQLERGVASALAEVECLRTLDRLRLIENLSDAEIAVRREAVFRLLEAVDIVEITRPVLARAAQPLPTNLGTLDAIHLATASLWKEQSGDDLVMATHDQALAIAARACGFSVLGVGETEEDSPERAARAKLNEGRRVLKRAGKGKPPVAGDER